jgi:hypothetical protein
VYKVKDNLDIYEENIDLEEQIVEIRRKTLTLTQIVEKLSFDIKDLALRTQTIEDVNYEIDFPTSLKLLLEEQVISEQQDEPFRPNYMPPLWIESLSI